MIQVTLTVNGRERQLLIDPFETLVHTIRERLQLTGTKKGCDQGSCGSCTLLVESQPILSCLTLTASCDGKDITTIEGVSVRGELHPVQREMVAKGAIQCGYCTPGIVMTAVAFLNENSNPTETEIRRAISGNLCRCTGYAKIVEAIKAAAIELSDVPEVHDLHEAPK